jgi:hypothetical protein
MWVLYKGVELWPQLHGYVTSDFEITTFWGRLNFCCTECTKILLWKDQRSKCFRVMSRKDSLRSTKLHGVQGNFYVPWFFFPLTFKILQPPFIHARYVFSREVHTREEALPTCSCNITTAQYIARTESTDITNKRRIKGHRVSNPPPLPTSWPSVTKQQCI